MAITQQQFDDLVAELERDAESHPQRYKLKLGAFALLGYCYIFGVLLLLIAAIGGVVAAIVAAKNALIVKLVIPLIVLVGVVLKALWIELESPTGHRLARRDHPALFGAIDEIRKATRAPRVDEVLLTNELNAAIVQLPRLGLLGWHKNYLILGLPLLQMVSVDEFKAVLAHEFGHLSGAHGRFGAWIYRVRATWSRLNASLQQAQHWGRFLFVPFFDWYAPKFAAYSFVQARQQEYEADDLSAKTVGAETAANALVRINLKAQDLDESYWPSIYKEADDRPAPAAAPFSGLSNPMRRGFLPRAPEQLSQALRRKTNTSDTHPCLSDRVAALGRRPSVPAPIATSAAETLFGNRLGELVARLDREWQGAVAQWWRDRHAHVQTGRVKLAAAAVRPPEHMNDVELYEYAALVEEFDDRDKAFGLYRTLVVERGAKQGAKFEYARLLLEKDGNAAIALLEEVMRDMPEATMAACDLIVGYLHAQGRPKEAQSYIDRYYERQQREHQAQVARATLSFKDKWLPATLSVESRAALTAALEQLRDRIKTVYLVRKQTPPGEPSLHVVGIVRRTRMLKLETGAAGQTLVDELAAATNANEEMLFITLEGDYQGFTKHFKKVAGARIV